jgi:hypothetical protein
MKKETCLLIYVAVSGERNVIKKEAEKILKFKDLTIENQRMWNVKTKEITGLIGVIGTTSESPRQYLNNILGRHEMKGLQKNSHKGHCTNTAQCTSVKV